MTCLEPSFTELPAVGAVAADRHGSLSTVKSSVLEAIGATPIVRMSRLFEESGLEVYGKLEALNPGGSMKDRAAYNILTHALAAGVVTHDSTVVESSSGNFAIGLAQVCAYLGLRLVCVVDIKTTALNIAIIEAYGARVDLVSKPDPESGEYLMARLKRVRQILDSVPNGFWPNQYANVNNSGAHYNGTMPEVVDALGKDIDFVVLATSTCGTLRGCADYIHDHGLKTKVVAVDAMGSVIFGRPSGKRLLPGHGAGIVPTLFKPDLADIVVHVSDLDCVLGCRRLVQQEAILAGASSGGVVSAIERLAADGVILPGQRVAAILADRGERYLDTVYSDAWVQEKLGNEALSI
jgi:N-(2-amino-2-carboxyethyl)-L-glutamate synthase